MKLETEVMELRRNLQQAVDHRLMAEQEKQDAQKEVKTDIHQRWSLCKQYTVAVFKSAARHRY